MKTFACNQNGFLLSNFRYGAWESVEYLGLFLSGLFSTIKTYVIKKLWAFLIWSLGDLFTLRDELDDSM
jgi:hypothetical protein